MRRDPFLASLSSGMCFHPGVRSPVMTRSRFTGFLLSCVGISLAAARGWGIKSGTGLLGVV